MTAGLVSAPLIIANTSLHTHSSRRDIDTDTPIFIQSDTPGVMIFYTLDGSRPAMVQGGSAARGRKYSRPIRLPAGRVAVRAVAVTSDGRESSIVTKMFVVQNQHSNTKEKNANINQQHLCEEPWCSVGSSELWSGGDDTFKTAAQNGPHLKNSDPLMEASCTQTSRPVQDSKLLQHRQVNMDMELLRCARCLSVRPSDPFSRFCPNCGAKLSEQRLPPTRVEQEHRLCSCCGSGNPANISSCLTCENDLQPVMCGSNTPSDPTANGRWCRSSCRWLNQHKSRFCSCCSSEPGRTATCVVCWRCGASCQPHSLHCAVCGLSLGGWTLPTTNGVTTAPPVDTLNSTATPLTDCPWKVATPTAEKSTQTIGLYYPSATQMQKERERAPRLSHQAARERQAPLTPISPGKGYWRMQLDHVCAHLRSYTQNNAPFRALLGDPCMGELVSAVVQEDRQQLTLTLSFALAGRLKKQGDAAAEAVQPSQPPADGSSLRSDPLAAGPRSSKHQQVPNPQSQVKDGELMAELGPGRGQSSTVQQLLDQGADPACYHGNGRHALAVAVLNGHSEVLPVLVQRGADVDQQSGPMKNSALHEAAALGSEGLQCAQVLLSCGAKVKKKNARGQTAFDVAISSGCNSMVALLAAQTGLVLLDRLAKHN